MLHFQFHTYVFVSLLVYHHQFHTIIFVLLSIYLPLFYTVLQYQFHTYVFVSLSIYLPLFYTHSASVSVSSDLFLDIDNLFNNIFCSTVSISFSQACFILIAVRLISNIHVHIYNFLLELLQTFHTLDIS